MRRITFVVALAGLLLPACTGVQTGAAPREAAVGAAVGVDSARLLHDIMVLAADSMQGRRTGTPGSERARRHLLQRFREIGLTPLGPALEQEFSLVGRDSIRYRGVNLVGYVPGTVHPERYLVVTAHYDHLGVRNGEIFNGADDNASGTAALLGLATHFRANPPRHSLVFAALDAEEMGLQGARALVATPPVPLERILVNVNMDMISRNDRNELYAAGTYHYPGLRPYVEAVAARAGVSLLMGHDRPDLPPGDDWTNSSDHGAFHAVGIPFVYFGVEDHPDYHKPTDVFANLQPGFYVRAAGTVLDFVRELDRGLAGQRPTAARATSAARGGGRQHLQQQAGAELGRTAIRIVGW